MAIQFKHAPLAASLAMFVLTPAVEAVVSLNSQDTAF